MIAFVYDNDNNIIAIVGKFESKKAGHKYIDSNWDCNTRRRFVSVS